MPSFTPNKASLRHRLPRWGGDMATATISAKEYPHHRPWYTVLYIQVLIAIVIGIAVGHFYPDLGKALKPLGDGFIALIKMMIAPVIFCTVVHGIGQHGRPEEARPRRRQDAGLFRGGLDPRARRRPAGRRGRAARRRLQHRSGHARREGGRDLRDARQGRKLRPAPDAASSRTPSSARSRRATCCRCCWSRSSPASR